MTRPLAILMGVVCALAACEGDLRLATSDGTPHGQQGNVSVGVPGETVGGQVCDGTLPPVADVPSRLLTSQEVNHSLDVLFPQLALPDYAMPYDSRVGTFLINSRENVSAPHIRDFRSMAEEVAARAAAEIDTVAACDAGDTACAHAAIDTLGSRAFRRPLTSIEQEGLQNLYALGAADGHAEGMRYVVEAVLQAPRFIYVVEGSGGDTLSGQHIAQRMAGLLWRGVPDEQLLAAAQAGELDTVEGRRAQATRMLEHPRATVMFRSLFMQWLGLDRIHEQGFAQDPDFDGLATAMDNETARFIDHVANSADADWRELFTARYTFVDAQMAAHYGVDISNAEEVSDGVWRVEVPGRAGVMSHAGFLSIHHGPVHRGLTIRKAVLCGSVASPTGIDLNSIETFPGESERSKSEKRFDHGTCGGCHMQMDPLGLAFEPYDSLGQFRTEDEHGNMVSGDGYVVGTEADIVDVSNAVELADYLSGTENAEACVAKHLFVWTYTRDVRSEDSCAVQSIQTHLAANDGNLRATLLALVSEPAFIERPQGVSQ